MKAWDKLKPDVGTINQIGRALKRFKASDDWERGGGIPHASTFINPDNKYWLHPENFLGGSGASDRGQAGTSLVEGRNLPTWG